MRLGHTALREFAKASAQARQKQLGGDPHAPAEQELFFTKKNVIVVNAVTYTT